MNRLFIFCIFGVQPCSCVNKVLYSLLLLDYVRCVLRIGDDLIRVSRANSSIFLPFFFNLLLCGDKCIRPCGSLLCGVLPFNLIEQTKRVISYLLNAVHKVLFPVLYGVEVSASIPLRFKTRTPFISICFFYLLFQILHFIEFSEETLIFVSYSRLKGVFVLLGFGKLLNGNPVLLYPVIKFFKNLKVIGIFIGKFFFCFYKQFNSLSLLLDRLRFIGHHNGSFWSPYKFVPLFLLICKPLLGCFKHPFSILISILTNGYGKFFLILHLHILDFGTKVLLSLKSGFIFASSACVKSIYPSLLISLFDRQSRFELSLQAPILRYYSFYPIFFNRSLFL